MPDDSYIFVNYMERIALNMFKWPPKADKLNTLKEDVLFACLPPQPANTTSSSRAITYVMTEAELKKAREMFSQVYYCTYVTFYILSLVCGWVPCVFDYSICTVGTGTCVYVVPVPVPMRVCVCV